MGRAGWRGSVPEAGTAKWPPPVAGLLPAFARPSHVRDSPWARRRGLDVVAPPAPAPTTPLLPPGPASADQLLKRLRDSLQAAANGVESGEAPDRAQPIPPAAVRAGIESPHPEEARPPEQSAPAPPTRAVSADELLSRLRDSLRAAADNDAVPSPTPVRPDSGSPAVKYQAPAPPPAVTPRVAPLPRVHAAADMPATPEPSLPPPPHPATASALMGRLRDTLPPPVRASNAATELPEPTRDVGLQPGRWTEQIVREHGGAARPRRRRNMTHRWLLVVAALATALTVVYWPELRAAYIDAYPGEAMKREALRACSAESPTFVRFLPEERDACYEHMAARLAGAQAATADDRPP